MGKAVPSSIKRRANELLELLKDKLTKDYYHNKQLIDSLGLNLSKYERNVMAAYLTRKIKELNGSS